MYRLGLWLGLGFVWGLRLQISLLYEFICIYIYIYMGFNHYIYIAVNPKQYIGINRYSKYIVPLAKPIQPLVRY